MENSSQHTSATPKVFTLQLLHDITKSFSEERIVGRGGYGVVYKGVLKNGTEIAVKKLYNQLGLVDDKQFHNECVNLMRAQHQNIIQLVGYCYETHRTLVGYDGGHVFAGVDERALCFEYLQGGSLDTYLSDESCRLDWRTCYKIIKGISEGLKYLHKGSEFRIYHLDLKPANILLDNNRIPKIGDFGLSRLFDSTLTHTTKTFAGTPGYMPPEYIDRQEITKKFDVFSLGVIIIQIMAGHNGRSKCADVPSQKFIDLVHGNWKKRMHTTMSQHTSDEVKICIKIALRCVEPDRVKRPTITEIVDELNKFEASSRTHIAQDSERFPTFQRGHQIRKSEGKHALNQQCASSGVGTKLTMTAPGSRSGMMIFSQKLVKRADHLAFLEAGEEMLQSLAVIGRGGCGEVFKAQLPVESKGELPQFIAIKKIRKLAGVAPCRNNLTGEDSRQLDKWSRQIQSEILTVGHIRHRNLLPLAAYVPRPDCYLLVYEYMKNGSLHDALKEGRAEALGWPARLHVAVGIAMGLEYLHLSLPQQIIHRDLKPANILLGDYMEPRIADFGLARAIPDGQSGVLMSNVGGTLGYIAPEYHQTYNLTAKCDIYSFGVIMAVLATGKEPMHQFFEDGGGIVKWLRRVDYADAIHAAIAGSGFDEQITLLLRVAVLCTADDPKERPAANDVLRMLSRIKN